ncbi:MAG: DUF4336 domain-containing protein [Myxococcota bacterium]|nr:DUF4336 domain-containing protein [Myxococcota bacterium]
MKALADGIWQIEGPSLNMLAGVMIPSRSTVLRLASGALLVYSPVAEMNVDGEAAHIVAPSRWHHLFVDAARTRWPRAAVHELAAPADDAIDSTRIDGVPKFDETVVFHRPTGTLVVADFVFNMTAENLRTRFGFWLTGVGGNRVAQSREWKWACKDRAAARASVERVLAWPIQRVAFCHGESVEIDSAGLAALMRI